MEEENLILLEINKIRSNPKSYISVLEEYKKKFEDGYKIVFGKNFTIKSIEGLKAVDDAICFLKEQESLETNLILSEGVSRAAHDLCESHSKGTSGHITTDGRDVGDRNLRYGNVVGKYDEILTYGFNLPQDIILQIIINDGVPSRTDRKILFSSNWKVCGIHVGPHTKLKHICSINLVEEFSQKIPLPFLFSLGDENITQFIDNNHTNTQDVDNHFDLSPCEKELFEEINLLRTTPRSYIPILEEFKTTFESEYIYIQNDTRQRIKTHEGKQAVDSAIEFLKNMSPVPPIKRISVGLCKASKDLVDSNGINGRVGHVTEDGRDLIARIERYGTRTGLCCENTDYGNSKAIDIVRSFIIDDGLPSRSHRNNLVSISYEVAGISIGQHVTHKWCTCVTLATEFRDKEHLPPSFPITLSRSLKSIKSFEAPTASLSRSPSTLGSISTLTHNSLPKSASSNLIKNVASPPSVRAKPKPQPLSVPEKSSENILIGESSAFAKVIKNPISTSRIGEERERTSLSRSSTPTNSLRSSSPLSSIFDHVSDSEVELSDERPTTSYGRRVGSPVHGTISRGGSLPAIKSRNSSSINLHNALSSSPPLL